MTYLFQYAEDIHLLDRHGLHHHLSVHPVRPHPHVLHHGSSSQYGQVQPAELQVSPVKWEGENKLYVSLSMN